MAQFLALFLILTQAFFLLATANETAHTLDEPSLVSSSSPPSPSLSKAPAIRKLGKHQGKAVKPTVVAPSLSPSMAPLAEDVHATKEVSASDQQTQILQVRIKKQHHSSMDKSVAGGGVILGGLAATFLVAVFCYIRATGRRNEEPKIDPETKIEEPGA